MIRVPRVGPALVLGMVAVLGGCGGDADVSSKASPVQKVIAPALLAKMWPVRLADNAARAPYEADPGWMHLFERSYSDALSAFQTSGNSQGAARVHLELAAIYRQGALVAANATHHVYGQDRVASDPLELQYMVGVSRAMRGDAAGAQAALIEAKTVPTVPAGAWIAWLKSGTAWPPDRNWLAGQVEGLSLGEPSVGLRPSLTLPQYRFKEQTAQASVVEANDPGALLALSEWHLAAARAAHAEIAADLPLLMNHWRLPPETPAAGTLSADPSPWIFARSVLCAEDLSFLADVDASGPGAVATWSEQSPLAAALAPAWDGEKLDHQLVLDQSVRLMRQAQAAMVLTSGGEEGFHRPFAIFVRLGVLRAGMRVADRAGQYRDAGILRLEALERMEGGKGSVQRDPAFALSVAAWDASNRSPLRPEDILHNLIPDFPALAAARAPLEALHLRLNRHAAPSTPVH